MRRGRLAAAWVGACVGLALGGAALGQEAPTPQAQGSTEVRERGGEPRVVPAYRPVQGWARDYVLLLRITPRVLVDLQEQPAAPAVLLETPVRFEVTQVTPGVGYVLVGVVGKPSVPAIDGIRPDQAARVTGVMAPAQGSRLVLELTFRGEVSRSQLIDAPGITPQAREMLQNLLAVLSQTLVPLPNEELGKGAKVRVTQPVEAEGLSLALTQDIEVTRLIRSGLAMRTELSSVMAPLQDAAGPDAPRSARVSGQVVLEAVFERPLPTYLGARTSRSTERAVDAAGGGGKSQSLRTIMNIEFTLREEPKPPAEVRQPGEPLPPESAGP
jgi:hypothetical protein